MVKSFQGVRMVEAKKTQTNQILVQDHMSTNLVTFHSDDTIDQVMEILTKRKISGGPVVDSSGALIGIISEVDCLREIIKGKYTNTPKFPAKVKEHMSTDVITIPPDLSLFDVAGKFLEHKIRRFPVLKNGRLVGQISLSDVIRAFPKLKHTTW
ncbi:CBS domain-containing protein [Algoriphagus zhangzhouensis]|uniref:CBS domain-containing protein n=1 Tax=Algoriphagus zhangzhouensis TaxID=1073327 RepID=A0A1M7ZJI3_9BACT|nr:CBS domain-containing protein [Algoriphagus zhangzhouensis]TDY43520.1 CBS domain protein [Algoriphagus zhangzhouensis]SHO65070.1 CBS domain-containing protein [Algoriphagus zhangzhouensis]